MKSKSSSYKFLRAIQAGNTTVDGSYGVSTVLPVEEGTVFITAIQFGDEWFEAVIDTGSSDTW